MTRIMLIVLLLAVLGWGWYRGESVLRARLVVPPPYDMVVSMFVAMWRLLMLSVTAVALIACLSLWWAQDAAAGTKQAAENLCISVTAWQGQALEVRKADVRIALGELDDAEQQTADAVGAIADAQARGVYDASPFVRAFLDADLARAQRRGSSLRDELVERQASLEGMRDEAILDCPVPATTSTTSTPGGS